MLDYAAFNARMQDGIDRDLSASEMFPEIVTDPVLVDLFRHIASQAADEINRVNPMAGIIIASDETVNLILSGLMVWCAGAGYASGAAAVVDDTSDLETFLARLLEDEDRGGA